MGAPDIFWEGSLERTITCIRHSIVKDIHTARFIDVRRDQDVSKVITTVFRSRESENSRQISGLYPNLRMADDRFNAGILRISEVPSGPAVCAVETPIKDTYHASVLFTVKP